MEITALLQVVLLNYRPCSDCSPSLPVAAVFLFLFWTESPRHGDARLIMDRAAPGGELLVYCSEEPGDGEVAGHFEVRELKSHIVWVIACPRELEGSQEA